MDNMGYVVQQPHSQTNPSPYYRVVDYAAWMEYVNGAKRWLPVAGEFEDYGSAKFLCDRLNSGD